ncbi:MULTISPECIES: hypothetical protein [Bacillaceae]|uniref:Uncharacterized protein n=1 Tax=Evansella alkalicola TaxID=745819 RepID=A0ABS6JYD7_9BACI|nr:MULTISPECIES: hypothetical protein [Bacillaceae]MBU9723606.1 hypothetical protein [Bacillus alkalicola]
MIIEEPHEVMKDRLHAVDIYLLNQDHAKLFVVEGDGHVIITDEANKNFFIIPENMMEDAVGLGYTIVK